MTLTNKTWTLTDLLAKFKQVYADAVGALNTEALETALKKRTLRWKSEHRIPLLFAADCYAQIKPGYNEFRPHMIGDLDRAFADDGIEVTPAREYSVGIYLHIPDKGDLRERVEEFVRANFQADLISWQDDGGTLYVWWD